MMSSRGQFRFGYVTPEYDATVAFYRDDLQLAVVESWDRIEERRTVMVSVGLFVRLEAKAGKERDVEGFLKGGLAIVQEEPATIAWFAIRLGPSTFGIFDVFPDDAGRQAHLSGRVAAALMAKAPELLSRPPAIEKVDILAVKL